MSGRAVISHRLSGYLDFLRFGAAFVVLLSHWAYPRFTDGQYSFIRELNLGSDAVVLFFVLSGFVITFAATEKDKQPGRYSFSRLSRLWSVAIPALALTVILDAWGVAANPDFYLDTPYYSALSSWGYWWRGLSFSSHWAGDTLRLGSNGPYWSLSYEAAYYLLFGILLYMRGVMRLVALLCCGVIFGLKILLLAPAWFMGVGVYLLLRKLKTETYSRDLNLIYIFAPLCLYVVFQFIDLPQTLRAVTVLTFGVETYSGLGFSDEFIWNAVIGLLFSVHLFAMGRCYAQSAAPLKGQSAMKWLAGGSFSLYLVHYPVLQWGGAALPRTDIRLLDHGVLLLAVLIACYVFAAHKNGATPHSGEGESGSIAPGHYLDGLAGTKPNILNRPLLEPKGCLRR